MAWIIQGGQLTNTEFPAIPDKPFHGDSPYTFWRIDENINNGMPFSPLMIGLPAIAQTGAFMDAAELRKVTVPQSCTALGRLAFAGTKLKTVKINADSTYSDTTFPEGCEVQFYGGGGDFGQLLDGDGFAVIDGDGCRAYINS
jgi:hypothetical protein